MLRFRIFGIPVLVEAWFWMSAVLLGGGLTASTADHWKAVAVWTGVMFVSVLVHELGHALAGRQVRALSAIKLHGFGGTTYLPGAQLSRRQSIWVSAAGPLASVILGLLVFATMTMGLISERNSYAAYAVRAALYINFVWTALNLLPIQPLDGGQIIREVLGPARVRLTGILGGVLAVGLCAYALREREIYLALMGAVLAFHNFRSDPIEGGVAKG